MKNIEIITSSQNAQIKLLGKLSQKKYRHKFGKFMIENLAIIYDALRDGYAAESLFATQEFINKHLEKFEYLQKNSPDTQFYLIDEKLNKQYSELEMPSGITAVYNIKKSALVQGQSVVYLNGVHDPGNLGTILRTALAFDFVNVVVDETCIDLYNAKTLGAAKDAIFKLNIIEDKDCEWLKENKNVLPIYAANSNTGTPLQKFQAQEIFCLVMGSESHGVSEDVLSLAQESIKIEISEKMESLNVAIATAILLYKLRKGA